MSDWRDISTAPKAKRGEPSFAVLICGRYPSNGQETDIVDSWWNAYEETWARWRHEFPPSYWMPRPKLPEEP